MNFVFVLDPLESIKVHKDSTVAIMREAARRGHAIYTTEQKSLSWREGRVNAAIRALTLSSDDQRWYSAGEEVTKTLASLDAVLMRKDPPFDMEYVYSTYLLQAAETQGARVYNKPQAIRDHNEKLSIFPYRQFITPTLVTRQSDLLRAFLHEYGDAIFKPLDGMGGMSVFRVRANDPNLNVIIETLTVHETRTIMAQKFIPEIVQGDKRILLIAGKPVPYALARIPKEGETRGNLAAGGRGVAQALSARDLEIIEGVAPTLWDKGLLLVGLDVIGDYLTEINVTSPTCFVEISQQTGFNVAGMFMDALEQTL